MRFEFLLVVIVGLLAVQLMNAEARDGYKETPNIPGQSLYKLAAFAR